MTSTGPLPDCRELCIFYNVKIELPDFADAIEVSENSSSLCLEVWWDEREASPGRARETVGSLLGRSRMFKAQGNFALRMLRRLIVEALLHSMIHIILSFN